MGALFMTCGPDGGITIDVFLATRDFSVAVRSDGAHDRHQSVVVKASEKECILPGKQRIAVARAGIDGEIQGLQSPFAGTTSESCNLNRELIRRRRR